MAGMTASSEQAPSLFAAPFWRVCAALLCVLLTTSLMNVVVFPRFDAVFTYARDVSVLANATTLIAVGLVATFRPQLLRMRALTAGCFVLLAMGSALLPAGLYAGSAVALVLLLSLLVMGVGGVFAPQMLAALGTPVPVLGEAIVYARVLLLSAPVFFLLWLATAVSRAVGTRRRRCMRC